MPNTGSHVYGRATGKSEGIGAPTLGEWIELMPRSAIGVVCRTFMQAADRTLPPLYAGWERNGYYRNVHYWVQRKPPSNLNIPRPFYGPDTDEHAIYWFNGAYMSIISQDRPGSANGKTLDAIYGDEAKLLNKKKYDLEISKASRGNVREFADLYCHGATLFLTDMPTTPESKWILEHDFYNDLTIKKYGIKYKMSDLMTLIANYQLKINRLKLKRYQTPKTDKATHAKLNAQIRSDEKLINYLRQETAMYSEASSLENIHFIGLKKLKMWKRDDLDIDFRTQVLNHRLYVTENGFYPYLDTDHHCYDAYNYSSIDSMGGLWLPNGVVKGCLNDGDLVRTRPLDVGMDAGGRINCLVVGQEHADAYKMLKAFFVKKPKLIADVVDECCAYYDRHGCKEVNFYYDHTFNGTDATRMYTIADAVRIAFVKNGWKVNMIYIGQQPGHDTRYRMWGEVLQEQPNRKPVRFNRNNCAQLIIACQCAGALQGSKGTEKDKRPEKRLDVPAEEATHLTDAMDTLYIGRFQNRLGYAPAVTEAFFGGV